MNDLDVKLMKLDALLHSYGELALALSCSDENSLFLVYAKRVLGPKVFALMADAEIFATDDKLLCQRIVREVDIELFFVPTREMHNLDFVVNDEKRCYYCKRYILGALAKTARMYGANAVSVGLTLDKLNGRLGVKASLAELGVVAPLAEAGITTEDMLGIAAKMNMVHPDTGRCMAERVPQGMPLDSDILQFLADAEAFLYEHNLYRARVEIIAEKQARILMPVDAEPLDSDAHSEILAFMQSRNFEIVRWEKLPG